MMGFQQDTHLKGHLFKLGLVNCSGCAKCKQAYEALATLSFIHLDHFMKPLGFEGISVSRILHFVQGVGMPNI
jgi:hypothetical protein